jgi:cytochrome P450
LKKAVAHAFTPQAVLEYEGCFDETIEELLSAMEVAKPIDMSSMAVYYSMDAAGRFSFSESLGCLEHQADVSGLIAGVRGRFRHWGQWSHLPILERVLYKNPLILWNSIGRPATGLTALAASKLKERRKALERNEVNHDLLQMYIEGGTKHPNELSAEGILGMVYNRSIDSSRE